MGRDRGWLTVARQVGGTNASAPLPEGLPGAGSDFLCKELEMAFPWTASVCVCMRLITAHTDCVTGK